MKLFCINETAAGTEDMQLRNAAAFEVSFDSDIAQLLRYLVEAQN